MPELLNGIPVDQRVESEPAAEAHSPNNAAGYTLPRVSVCIVNRNCRELLRACLASLLHQAQGVGVEVIVVDNASTDGAAEMVAQAFPTVRLLRNKTNQGFSRANNQAAYVAQGQYLFFLNNDTVVPAGTLARLIDCQETYPRAWLIGPRLVGTDGQVQRGPRRLPGLTTFLHRTCLLRWTGLFRRQYQQYCRQVVDPRRAQPVEVLMGAALFVRRDRMSELGGWDEDFFFGGEDMELCLRAGRRGAVLHAPDISITHHGRASTRLFIGEASTHILVGFTRFLRKLGTPAAGIVLYKVILTLDTPVQMALKTGQLGWRMLRGQWSKARKCWNDLKGLFAFMTRGIWRLWWA